MRLKELFPLYNSNLIAIKRVISLYTFQIEQLSRIISLYTQLVESYFPLYILKIINKTTIKSIIYIHQQHFLPPVCFFGRPLRLIESDG
jgi:hypothetical protein